MKADYSKLKEEIKQISDIASNVPEAFREKCFEILLNNLLTGVGWKPPEDQFKRAKGSTGERESAEDQLPMPAQLKVFMQRTRITEDDLKSIIMVADNEVHFIKEPTTRKVATGQMQWALLLALKTAVENNNFAVDPEAVRSICQDKGYYDPPNFAANFKKPKNAKLFKGPMENQGEPQILSNEGQSELAKLIRNLASHE